ncbi:MAG: UDP-glucose dehydrogenase family protein [Dehalococcoidia bacterium]
MAVEPLNIGVIGLGHVGLPTALCFADLGWKVVGTDHDAARIEELKAGRSPLYEPGVRELLSRHLGSGRFVPTDDVGEAIRSSLVLFICVGTPQAESGDADLSQVESVARIIAGNLNGYKLIVEKSTVPITTAQSIKRTLLTYRNDDHDFDLASNPEFLREGNAVEDFLNPHRIVLGVESDRARTLLLRVYEPLLRRLGWNGNPQEAASDPRVLVTKINTAEIIKHASNAFLATKISFINMIADLCETTGADVTEVARGVGMDSRIAPSFLQAGIGYGGYCLPKDVRALVHIAEEQGLKFSLLEEVDHINAQRIDRFADKARRALWVVQDKAVGVLGLAFKPGTDDIRGAPSLNLLRRLLDEGARLRLHDPQAMDNVRRLFPEERGRLSYSSSPYDSARGADALLILTDWEEYRRLDLARIRKLMKVPILIDGRNIYDPKAVRDLGFEYFSVGRP